MERLKGVIIRRQYPEGMAITSDQVRSQFSGLIAGLANLHSIDIDAVGLGNFGRPIGYRQRQLDGWCKRLENAGTPDMTDFGEVTSWLADRMPKQPEVGAVVHNDFKIDNLVWNPADVTKLIGVLDWEMSTVGDPLMDLACTLSFWAERSDPSEFQALRSMPTARPEVFSRKEAVARYEALTGRKIGSIDFYLCFGFFRRAVIEQQKYARYLRGETQDPRFAMLDADIRVLRDMSLRIIHRDLKTA
jgi:aminoglycoside phosphotransferase (APT) family kinase protein